MLFLISILNDVLLIYIPPPELTDVIHWNVLPFTSTIYATPTNITPPSVVPDELPVSPAFDPFLMKSDPSIVKLLVELPVNVPTIPCVDAAAEIPKMKLSLK
jgi:hypothetical protein